MQEQQRTYKKKTASQTIKDESNPIYTSNRWKDVQNSRSKYSKNTRTVTSKMTHRGEGVYIYEHKTFWYSFVQFLLCFNSWVKAFLFLCHEIFLYVSNYLKQQGQQQSRKFWVLVWHELTTNAVPHLPFELIHHLHFMLQLVTGIVLNRAFVFHQLLNRIILSPNSSILISKVEEPV